MKPLEKIFFTACIHNCICESYNEYMIHDSIREIIKIFVDLGFSWKQLEYYLTKWSDSGFYNYGVNLELGWFEFDKLKGEYKTIYTDKKQMGNG